VAKYIAADLVGGESFSIDASLIEADVDKKKRVPGNQPIAWPRAEEASRAVREYLAALDAAHKNEERGGDNRAALVPVNGTSNDVSLVGGMGDRKFRRICWSRNGAMQGPLSIRCRRDRTQRSTMRSVTKRSLDHE